MVGMVAALTLSPSAAAQSPTIAGYAETGAAVLPAVLSPLAPGQGGPDNQVAPAGQVAPQGQVAGAPERASAPVATASGVAAADRGSSIRHAASPAPPAAQSPPAGAVSSSLSTLPFTGSDLLWLSAAALTLVGAGIGLRWALRSPRKGAPG